MRVVLILIFLSLFACTRPKFVSTSLPPKQLPDKSIQVRPQSLKVIKTQELLGDELLLVGAIGIMEGDKIRTVQVFSSYLGKVKNGQMIRLDTIRALAICLLPGQKASYQLSLFEVEDYQPTKKWLHRFNTVSGVLSLPLALTSTENPVTWFLWGMKAGSLGLDWLSELDLQDLLGISETQWNYDSVNASNREGKWIGGKRFLDAYEYQYMIQINVD